MHPRVLGVEGWRVVRKLAAAGVIEGWTLAGGTGLAIQFGHRRSDDLDFFGTRTFDPERILSEMVPLGRVGVQSRAADTLHATLDGLRVSFLAAEAPLLFPATPYRRLDLADPRDVAVMKVIAIGGRGSRKDFVDLFFLLRAGIALDAIFEWTRRRFRSIDYNEYHLLRSLVYFDDAESEPMPSLIRRVTWREIKAAIVTEVRRQS